MKWIWVVLIVVLVPVSAPAADHIMRAIIEYGKSKGGDGGPEYPYRSVYVVKPEQELEHVKIKIRLNIDTSREIEKLAGAKCTLLMGPTTLALSQIIPIHGDSRSDFWVSRLNTEPNGTLLIVI